MWRRLRTGSEGRAELGTPPVRLAGMSPPLGSDAARFEAVFEAHHRRVLAYALRRTDSPADAEDVVAETFAVGWRRVEDLPELDRALTWLLAVARRVAANQRRGARRRGGLFARLRAQPVAQPAADLNTPALDALSRLRRDDQELLRLLAWDGLSQAEAGEVLGISANAVAIRLHRARKHFAAELAAIESETVKGLGLARTHNLVNGNVSGQKTGNGG